MAKTVSEVRQIELLDGTEVTLRPASIKVLRKIMKTVGTIKDLEPNEELEGNIMDILVTTSAVALQKQLPDVTKFVDLDPEKDEEEYEKNREEYEEMVDMDIVSLVNEVCGGIKFDAPNPMNPAEAAGTN
jgi:hypothetical protein